MGSVYPLLTTKQRGMIMTYEHPYLKFISFTFRRTGNNVEISNVLAKYSDNFGGLNNASYQLNSFTTYAIV